MKTDSQGGQELAPVQRAENRTGLPDNLKAGIENLSGYSMADVKVHYNSSQPAQLNAHAYAQGSHIHVAPGQERHLPHEAWHVVQQKQGRVRPTAQLKGKINLNDDNGLEHEADVMGTKALTATDNHTPLSFAAAQGTHTVQRVIKSKDLKSFLQEQIELQNAVKNTKAKTDKPIAIPPRESQSDGKSQQTEIQVDGPQEDRKGKEPEEAPPKYTTLGFEHEFAQMTDGLLRGVSHVELATSDMQMPLTKLPFVLETDAGNEVELVSPPFLFETHPDIPIPDPEEVAFVDYMLEMALRTHTREDGTTTLGNFIQAFGAAYGFTFNWKTNKKQKLELEPKNMTYNTDISIHKGIIKSGIHAIDTVDLDNIHIGPGVKGQQGMSSDKEMDKEDKAELEKNGGNHSGAVISQANLATDARVIEMVRQLGGGRSDQVETYLAQLTAYFRQKLFFQTFGNKRKGMDKLIGELTVLMKQVETLYRQTEMHRRGEKLDSFLEQMGRHMKTLRQPDLGQGETVRIAENIAKLLTSAADNLKGAYQESTLEVTSTKEDESGVKENKEEIKLEVYARQLIHRLKTLPELGSGSPSLRMFLGVMARTLAGQLAVPAQKKLKEAQEKRFSSSIYKSKMDEDVIGIEANLTSRVKDLDQAWVKDNIINIGTGILEPKDWQEVVKLFAKGSGFRENLEEEMPKPEEPKTDKGVEVSKKLGKYRNKLEKQVLDTMDNILKYIKQKKLTTDHPDNSPIGPKKTPNFMGHDSSFIDPRQDTFLDTERVQLPQFWPNRRLHVLEIRWKSTEQLRKLRAFYESGFAPQGGERYIHRPDGVVDELWYAFLQAIDQVPREEIDDRPYAYSNMYVGVVDQNKKGPSTTTDKEKKQEEKRGFDANEFDLIENMGGGDCLFHALAGRDLDPEEVLRVRGEIAEERTRLPEGQNNAHAIVTALYQTGMINEEDLRALVEGRHNMPNSVLAAMQRIPGIYAGDEELIQYCIKEQKTVLVVDSNGSLLLFDAGGSHPIAYTPETRIQVLTESMAHTGMALFKTPNHWRQIISLK